MTEKLNSTALPFTYTFSFGAIAGVTELLVRFAFHA